MAQFGVISNLVNLFSLSKKDDFGLLIYLFGNDSKSNYSGLEQYTPACYATVGFTRVSRLFGLMPPAHLID